MPPGGEVSSPHPFPPGPAVCRGACDVSEGLVGRVGLGLPWASCLLLPLPPALGRLVVQHPGPAPSFCAATPPGGNDRYLRPVTEGRSVWRVPGTSGQERRAMLGL